MDVGTKLKMLRQLNILVESSEYFKPQGTLGEAHALRRERARWFCLNDSIRTPFAHGKPLYDHIEADTLPDEVAERTGLVVFIGAAHSPELEFFLNRPGCRVVVFEPRMKSLVDFLERVEPVQWAKAGAKIFAGHMDAMPGLFSEYAGGEMFAAGFPVFYVREGLDQALPDYVEAVVERLEVLFYRHRIYPVEGQQGARSRPLRDITKGLFFDQQKHLYENIPLLATAPDLTALRDMFRGVDAVLAAPGPDLLNKLDYVRECKGRALVVAVSKAAQVLKQHGIEPDFVVANDTSLTAEESFADYDLSRTTVLVGHSLSYLPDAKFRKVFPFGNVMEEAFGRFVDLRLYGSVITTAFSLARFLGCTRHILVGVQLGSLSRDGLAYAGNGSGLVRALIRVDNPLGVGLQTSLNFRDASFWFLDEIRRTGTACVNTCRESVLHGPGVEYDEAPQIRAADVPGLMEKVFAVPGRRAEATRVRDYLQGQTKFWRQVAQATGQLTPAMYDLLMELAVAPPKSGEFPKPGVSPQSAENAARLDGMASELLATFDRNGVSHLVDRFEDFNHRLFYAKVFASDSGHGDMECNGLMAKVDGMHYYLWHVQQMAKFFLQQLVHANIRLNGRSGRDVPHDGRCGNNDFNGVSL
jgi:hypothetical protein